MTTTRTDEELMAQARALHQAIFVAECFGGHDLLEYDALLAELERRGYEVVSSIAFRRPAPAEEEHDPMAQ